MAYLLLAISLAANPFALAGYIAIGVVAPSPWRALRYGALWGLAIQLFVVAMGRIDILNVNTAALTTGLRVAGAALLTLLVYALARLVRRRGGPPPGTPPRGSPPRRRRRRNLRVVR